MAHRQAPVMFAAVALLAAVVPSSSAFSATTRLNHRKPLPIALKVSALEEATATATATLVKPRTKTSLARRRKALESLDDRNKSLMEASLYGVDAQMLEILSEHFLYPENLSASVDVANSRPKGRPKFVPGAMNHDTMVKFRERQDVIDMLGRKRDLTTAVPFSPQKSPDPIYLDIPETENEASVPIAAAKLKKSRGVKGVRESASSVSELKSVHDETEMEREAPKQRKRVVKSLPKARTDGDAKAASSKDRHKGGNKDLFKYYRTELLNSHEEYSLGMKTQFMIKCEQVHEGLSTRLMRLPTIEEWAEACG
jgi:hypothetical protein